MIRSLSVPSRRGLTLYPFPPSGVAIIVCLSVQVSFLKSTRGMTILGSMCRSAPGRSDTCRIRNETHRIRRHTSCIWRETHRIHSDTPRVRPP